MYGWMYGWMAGRRHTVGRERASGSEQQLQVRLGTGQREASRDGETDSSIEAQKRVAAYKKQQQLQLSHCIPLLSSPLISLSSPLISSHFALHSSDLCWQHSTYY